MARKQSETVYTYTCSHCNQGFTRKYKIFTEREPICKDCRHKLYFGLEDRPLSYTYTCVGCNEEFTRTNKVSGTPLCRPCRRQLHYIDHRDDLVSYGKKRYNELREAGLCVTCKKPAAPGQTHCEPCGTAEKEKVSQQFKERQQGGLCTVCGAEPLPGKKRCGPCTISQREYQRTFRAKKPKVIKEIVPVEKTCAYCGNSFTTTKKVEKYCTNECRTTGQREKRIGNWPEYYDKKKEKAIENNLCNRCLNPLDNNKWVVCTTCREKENEKLREYWRQKNGKNKAYRTK